MGYGKEVIGTLGIMDNGFMYWYETFGKRISIEFGFTSDGAGGHDIIIVLESLEAATARHGWDRFIQDRRISIRIERVDTSIGYLDELLLRF
jgi:hypothetical protein